MTVVFTICAANYLAQAKVLGDSLLRWNPSFRFVIGLVDRVPEEIEPEFWSPYSIVPLAQLESPGLVDMRSKYDLVELATAVKPLYFEYFYREDSSIDEVIYLDPDIAIFGSFDKLRSRLSENNIVVTPHSATYDQSSENLYYETGMLTTGVYNLGFMATRRSSETERFLNWWRRRVENFCYYEPGFGVFVDQLWITLAPLYFPGVYVEKGPGYNMCYWNHFERRLSRRESVYWVNEQHRLIFYHFSSYRPEHPELIARRSKARVATFAERPDLRGIYDDYREALLTAGYDRVRGLRWSLPKEARGGSRDLKIRLREGARRMARATPLRGREAVRRLAYFMLNSLK